MISRSAAVFVLALALAAASANALPPYCGIQPGDEEDLSAAYQAPPASANATLISVQVFARHGDRVQCNAGTCWPNDGLVHNCTLGFLERPSTSFTTDSIDSVDFAFRLRGYENREDLFPGNCILGQLTDEGFTQHVNNGKYFRSVYVDQMGFLPDTFPRDQVFFRADDSDRTRQSAQGIFSGLYPNTSSSGQTVEVDLWTMDTTYDSILDSAAICPLLNNYTSEIMNTSIWKDYAKDVVKPLTKKFAAAFNVAAKDISLGMLFDCYFTHVCHGAPVPDVGTAWDELVAWDYWTSNFTATYMRLPYSQVCMGRLLNEMVGNMKRALSGATNPKFWVFVGHDSNVGPWSAAFGNNIYNAHTPYAGIFTLELYQMPSSPSGYAVRLLRQSTPVIPEGCSSEFCDWDEFQAMAAAMVPTPKLCSTIFPDSYPTNN